MNIYILFQTDKHKYYYSRVFFGVYSSYNKALEYAKANDLINDNSEIEIIESILDKFEEL